MSDREKVASEVNSLEKDSLALFVLPPNRNSVLHLMGGFIQAKRFKEPYYTWDEHRSWILTNNNKEGNGHRGVSTRVEHQVYVVNTTYQPTNMQEVPYVCEGLYPLGGSYADTKDLPLFHKGFIGCGSHNGKYNTLWRDDDTEELHNDERFFTKLYFYDKSRLVNGLKKNLFPPGAVGLAITARVRDGDVIGFRSAIRTNVSIGGMQREDISFRSYEKDHKGWGAKIPFSRSEFEQSSGDDLADEVRYHCKLHLDVYNLITNFTV